jgi:hypothetical protein
MSILKRVKFNQITFSRLYKYLKNKAKNTYYTFIWMYSKSGKLNRFELKKLVNKHSGEDVILVANGPGLNKIDFKLFDNKVVFGMNRIYLSKKINIDYLCCINDLVTKQFKNDFNKLSIPTFFKFRHHNYIKKNKNYFFETGFLNSSFSCDISKGLNPAATVTYACLQIIFHMGFKRVFIVGLDHNFSFNGNVNETQKVHGDSNHFIKDYFPKGSTWETPDLLSSEYFYKEALTEFEKHGKEIIDCSVDGKCNIFPKMKLENIINQE